ncbi:NUDIX hydrolase [Taklimakanibacter lacteus]|uniref:NUDIX hydrolase n=1 Tax=Taklimakanibacter lacteus TaxID=2268456 RepID=UPI000E674815
MNVESTIRIAAAIIFDKAGQVLVVRKRGSPVFMQPGGKIEPGETPAAALARELREEIGLVVERDTPLYLGRFTAQAAHENGRLVEAETFEVALAGQVAAASEIEEITWVDPFGPLDLPLAILSRDHMMPLARSRRQK